MKEKSRKLFHSLYWHQFELTAGIVLLTLLLLGMSFFALSYTTNVSSRRAQIKNQAEIIAQMSQDYFMAGWSVWGNQDEALQKLAGVASQMTDVDFLICNEKGAVLLTTENFLAGHVVSIPDEISHTIWQEGSFEGRSTLGGIYEKKQAVVGVPVQRGQTPLGLVVAVMDLEEMMEIWRSFTGLFSVITATVLLIAFVGSSFMAMRQIQPIQEMVYATRAYGEGNFDVRMSDSERTDEFGELARSFNAMADSLQETERQRRDFIANVSHELKTPMTTIAGYTDGILDGTIPAEKEKHYLQIISEESRRLSRLVRRMLDISRLQSQEIQKENFDLCESMRLALLSMEQKITDRGLDVQAEIPEDSIRVTGNNDLITQVIYNLLENAAKFASPGSTLYLGVAVENDKARVAVGNHGATIPPEEIPLLFERFHKSDKSRSEDKDGYGLGLYVVKTILTQHKEEIDVVSENGFTTFSFTMSLAKTPQLMQRG